MEPSIFVILPVHNDNPQVVRLIRELDTQTVQAKLVVVDNGSTDGTVANIKQNFPHVFVIENKANLGIVKGYNVGFAFAKANRASHVLLLEPVVSFTTSDVIAQLLAKKTPMASTVITIMQKDKLLYGLGGNSSGRLQKPHYQWQTVKPPKSFNATVPFVSAACVLIELALLLELGNFDEQYGTVYAMIDLCAKARQKKYKIAIVPTAFVKYTVAVLSKAQQMHQFNQLKLDARRYIETYTVGWIKRYPSLAQSAWRLFAGGLNPFLP